MTTPMMQQWNTCKKKAGEAILLFRLGDFYEAFHDDAQKLSDLLGLTLTQRHGIPMSGIPYHAAEKYIEKLIGKNQRIAIAEQTEDPKETKGIVKREIVRTISPGTVLSETMLKEKQSNYFAALSCVGKTYGIAYTDLSTGEFKSLECQTLDELINETKRIAPKEVLITNALAKMSKEIPGRITRVDAWRFDPTTCIDFLCSHFRVAHLDGFGFKEMPALVNAAGALLHYLSNELILPIDHIKRIEKITPAAYMAIDNTTAIHLELFTEGGLLDSINTARTPMGARLVLSWLKNPLLSKEQIERRQDAVATLLDHTKPLIESLHPIRDLERLITRLSTKNSAPRDLIGLKLSLISLPNIKQTLKPLANDLLKNIDAGIDPLDVVTTLITKGIVENPPLRLSDGNIIAKGYSSDLDELRHLKENAEAWLKNYQEKLRHETGIKNLKVGFNKAFGYFIEVTRANSDRMPIAFHKRQTLVNNERFISEELKAFEENIFSAEEKITSLEGKLYSELLEKICTYEDSIRKTAKAIANLDALVSHATLAKQSGYVRPTIDDSHTLIIEKGRHPVLESRLLEQFIPNDTALDGNENRLVILTGPNMAGKSTYIRQVALIVLLAQIGSYIPAHAATIGIIDKLFTRIGASDDLARGQSTFMVEMSETANILNNATENSLVILDEIGRGTSTYDGISIAWAVAEELLLRRCKTLFATHYFELTALEDDHIGAINCTVSVVEEDEKISFLHKIVRGSTDRSYGIHVARLAGLPNRVIERAKNLLAHLETEKIEKKSPQKSDELDLFTETHPIVNELDKVDPDRISPLEALQILSKWKNYS
ncbi:MAG: DNA mismatch repair protein MutS [Simkaniaceae bacterium]|nr:DNA mismatch repair protein MutS [Simkaniaceae bacterium]